MRGPREGSKESAHQQRRTRRTRAPKRRKKRILHFPTRSGSPAHQWECAGLAARVSAPRAHRRPAAGDLGLDPAAPALTRVRGAQGGEGEDMKSSLRKLRGFALQRHEQRVDRDRDRGRGHSAAAATAADELLAAAEVRGPCFLSLWLRERACEPGGWVSQLLLWRSRRGALAPLLVYRSSHRGLMDST